VLPTVECVPNLSEGGRIEVIDAGADAISATPGVMLLDRTSDLDHGRSVLTFAGSGEDVLAAVRRLAAEVIARIDMRAHQGRHPRVGALDVVPFVPLGDMPMETCVGLARSFGTWLAERYELPVFLYGRAAQRADRRLLAPIRRPGFGGLRESLATDDGAPDLGPRRPHPTAGATIVGARQFLVAWNIQLASNDLGLAAGIARSIRERDGGLPAVQALGISLASMGCVQVSMNLLDHERTPMWRVFERVRDLAASNGTSIRDSELIGLAPLRSFLARVLAAARWLMIRDATADLALELRLAARLAAPG
jgi:glutamate formiminotransferase